MASFSNLLVLTSPAGVGEDMSEIRGAWEEKGEEETTDFRKGQGDERLCLSLKGLREETVEVGGLLFFRSSRGSRP